MQLLWPMNHRHLQMRALAQIGTQGFQIQHIYLLVMVASF